MSNGREGFNLKSAIQDIGLGKQRIIQKMFTKAAGKGEDVVEDILEAISRKMGEGVEGIAKNPLAKGAKAIAPWVVGLFNPAAGTGTKVALEAWDTHAKHQQFQKLISEMGGIGNLPGWARGSFLENYIKDAISQSRSEGVGGLKQKQKISDIVGGVSTVMSALPFFQGKGGEDIAEDAFKDQAERFARESIAKQQKEGFFNIAAGTVEEQIKARAAEHSQKLMAEALKEQASKVGTSPDIIKAISEKFTGIEGLPDMMTKPMFGSEKLKSLSIPSLGITGKTFGKHSPITPWNIGGPTLQNELIKYLEPKKVQPSFVGIDAPQISQRRRYGGR